MPTKKTVTKKSRPKASVKKTAAKPAAKAKVTKKAPAKKAATKKVATKKKTAPKKPKSAVIKRAGKDLVYASDEQSFWVQNGEVLNSLLALNDAFGRMDTNIYQFHAHGDSNDFSIWVDTVLCDDKCAAALAKAKTPKSARTIVVKHLKLYSA